MTQLTKSPITCILHSQQLYFDCRLLAEKRPAISNNLRIVEKYFQAQQFRRWQYGSIFIRLAVVASQNAK